MFFRIVIPIFFLLNNHFATAQGHYELNWKRETVLIVSGGTIGGLAQYFSKKTPLFTPDELMTLNPNDVNPFDRLATHYSSENAHRMSNYFWYGSQALPILFLAGKDTRKDFGEIGLIYGETVLINAGMTFLAKSTFRRPRPYVFDPDADLSLKQKRNARASFVSGHTSMTAASTFFMAKVFSDYYPDSKWKPVVWTAAATIPAITGYLRVRAGRHYPTDVIAGYALGATIGYIVPHLHRNKIISNPNIQLGMGMNSAYFQMAF